MDYTYLRQLVQHFQCLIPGDNCAQGTGILSAEAYTCSLKEGGNILVVVVVIIIVIIICIITIIILIL